MNIMRPIILSNISDLSPRFLTMYVVFFRPTLDLVHLINCFVYDLFTVNGLTICFFKALSHDGIIKGNLR
jgi:hypothetical protein